MKDGLVAAGLVVLLTGCATDAGSAPPRSAAQPSEPAPQSAQTLPKPEPFDATPFVDPFIGTGGHGHTFPGATVPFGMVQLSPDTRLTGWDGCSGYHHDDTVVHGFSHTHLSGTGCSDYGDVLLMPTVGAAGPSSRFSHANETASAGAYSVFLDDTKVKVELTATTRVGVHRYTFPETNAAGVLVDLAHRDEVIYSSLEIVGDREVRGFRRSRAWAQDQRVYFVARFSKPFTGFRFVGSNQEVADRAAHGKDVKASLRFETAKDEAIVVKVGLSGVDCEGAAKNLDAEVPGFDFDSVRDAAREAWRKQLSKIEVKGGTDAQLRTFYTALYHCCIAPNVWSDVDGRYRGRDMKVHEAKGWTQYTVFSLWDTFRALHPLMTILEPERTNDWINTFLAQYREGGALPVWELAANETDCMIGYHAVPVIADAYAKGIRGYDANAALEAMVASANRDVRGLKSYREQGFVPADEEGESVSKTLEYAYDDWCIAEMAFMLGRADLAGEFEDRAQSWKNIFDPKTKFFRPRRNQAWVEPFDPAEVNFHLTEANSWQYSMFVPHDISGLSEFVGPREALAKRLDELFTAPSQTKGREQADITGLIGQYAHGNEPSHHMAYLYDFCGQPWKTQERVRQIVDTLYSDRPDGLCGNEDCGQMSAWYVLSALGFYPVCPGKPEYVIGTPLFAEAAIHLDGGATFTVRTSGGGTYVQSATLNRKPLLRAVLEHATIVDGGEVTFATGAAPSKWGDGRTQDADDHAALPWTSPRGREIVPVPFATNGERIFRNSTAVDFGLASTDMLGATRFFFSTDGGSTFARHEGPVRLDATTDLLFYAESPGVGLSRRARARFVKLPHDWRLTLAHPYAPQYAASGPTTLIDGLRGGRDFRTGDWQGFEGVDLDATIDLGAVRELKGIRAGFLQDTRSWIWMPTEVRFLVSDDGKTYRNLGAIECTLDERDEATQPLVFQFNTTARARFVRVVGKNRGTCPAWHPGAGHEAWLFADEIGIDTAD